MKKTYLLALVFVLFLAGVTLTGCCDDPKNPENVRQISNAHMVNYNNGVYYFPYTKADFGNNLSSFLKQHQELQIVTITGDGTNAYGEDAGYFVVFQNKQPLKLEQ